MADNTETVRLSGDGLAKDLFEDMGRKVDGMGMNGQANGDEPEQKVVDEIESLCMNCREDVR